jgi:scyllo-inositol 2-dehydrogenase (NADP+)
VWTPKNAMVSSSRLHYSGANNIGTLTTVVDGKPKKQIYPTIRAPTYVGYYQDFAAAIRGERTVPITPEDGRDVIRIIEAAIQSSKEDKTVVLS